MSTHSVHRSSFLIFVALLSSSISGFVSADTNVTVTDILIQEICHQTRNPSLCLNNLKPFKGKSLCYINPVAALGGNTLNEAQSRANRTVTLIWAQYRGISVHKPELRSKYYICFSKYEDVKNQLSEAKNYMLSRYPKLVKAHVSAAVDRVNSCDKELMKPPRDESPVLQANGHLKDLCSIILAICNKMKTVNLS